MNLKSFIDEKIVSNSDFDTSWTALYLQQFAMVRNLNKILYKQCYKNLKLFFYWNKKRISCCIIQVFPSIFYSTRIQVMALLTSDES
jgi:hypothetical protein